MQRHALGLGRTEPACRMSRSWFAGLPEAAQGTGAGAGMSAQGCAPVPVRAQGICTTKSPSSSDFRSSLASGGNPSRKSRKLPE